RMRENEQDKLGRGLERLERALQQLKQPLASSPLSGPQEPAEAGQDRTRALIGLISLVVAAAQGHRHHLLAATAFGFLGLFFLLVPPSARRLGAKSKRKRSLADRPRVGMGASVATNAVLEPGAVVEMGASIGKGA